VSEVGGGGRGGQRITTAFITSNRIPIRGREGKSHFLWRPPQKKKIFSVKKKSGTFLCVVKNWRGGEEGERILPVRIRRPEKKATFGWRKGRERNRFPSSLFFTSPGGKGREERRRIGFEGFSRLSCCAWRRGKKKKKEKGRNILFPPLYPFHKRGKKKGGSSTPTSLSQTKGEGGPSVLLSPPQWLTVEKGRKKGEPVDYLASSR